METGTADSTAKRPRRIQFHLTTIILLVSATAWMLRLNLVPRVSTPTYFYAYDSSPRPGWPFRDLGDYPPIVVANGLSCLLILYFLFKILNRLNSPSGVSPVRRIRQMSPATLIAMAMTASGFLILNLSNPVSDGAWLVYGWPIRAYHVYQLQRVHAWGYVSDDFENYAFAVDVVVAIGALIVVFLIVDGLAKALFKKRPQTTVESPTK